MSSFLVVLFCFVLPSWYFHVSLPVFLLMSDFVSLYKCIRMYTTSPPPMETQTVLQYVYTNNTTINISVHICKCFPVIYFLKYFSSNEGFYEKPFKHRCFCKAETGDYKDYKQGRNSGNANKQACSVIIVDVDMIQLMLIRGCVEFEESTFSRMSA